MFETNVHVVLGENGERNRKYAEIYCENDTEMKTIDTNPICCRHKVHYCDGEF